MRCAPSEAGGSSWAVVLPEVEPVRMRGQDGAVADVTARVAVPVFVSVEGTEHPDLRVEEMSAVLAAPGRIEWRGLLENRGNTVLKVSGVLAIEERDEELAAGGLEDVLILPGSTRRVHGVVGGDFRAAAEIRSRLWIRFGSRAGEAMQADCAVVSAAAGSEQPGRAF